MKNIRIEFIDKCYEDAVKLKKGFKKTEEKEWNIITVLLELGVQIGHLFDLKCNNIELKENNRNINNIGDEISDVLLQTLYLGFLENVDFKKEIKFEYSNIEGLMVLYGQLVEAVMEEESYRFKKERNGFENRLEFIKDRILKIYILTINYSLKINIDVITEFNKMKEDAEKFLKNYEKNYRM